MFSFLNNIPQVTRNILILNLLLYFLSQVLLSANVVDLFDILSAHYINSPLFKPYQIVSHMFMHSPTQFTHIIFNMFILVTFGSHLEKIWGEKRFFIFYILCGLGAFVLYNALGFYELHKLKNYLIENNVGIDELNHSIINNTVTNLDNYPVIQYYKQLSLNSMLGASGALFGIMAGFAILFPNTELMIMFLPVPIKAKFLIGGYFIYELYNSVVITRGDNVAHLAHVGGAIVGAIIILYWRKTDKKHFW